LRLLPTMNSKLGSWLTKESATGWARKLPIVMPRKDLPTVYAAWSSRRLAETIAVPIKVVFLLA